MVSAGKLDHGKAVGVRGELLVALEGLAAGGGHEDAVEAETLRCGERDAGVAEVGRIETATKERCAH